MVVAFNALLVALRFRSEVPLWLTLFGPLVLGGFAIWRAIYWRPRAVAARSIAILRRDLRMMSWLGAISGFMF
ncbi:MAG: hypothetical protein B7Y31_13970, partial [Novosphingobium sp. 16-62-11]